MAAEVGEAGSAGARGDQLAAALTRSLEERQVLCDLLSAQAGVLERNVSADLAGQWKRTAIGNVDTMARLIRHHLPELGDRAQTLCAQTIMITAAVWTHARPSAAMLDAYDADPSLAVLRMDFAPTLRDMLSTLIAGTLTRAAAP
ncbi:hypothetical protein HD597_001739 [Nonomuraea thailandensis]|uniref:Tetracyclin repressor-like C-terminal domain-containing protein n=1 Tax=Nonomuraea thailandensis TaxID=1188745 RepID=A0A9X2G8Y4_9ACTN|nr:hypothetical protein [Nonomuraea thailandensis]MCP2354719.1 hypothetical protein [Nonomuraea thailandensis]